MNTETPRDWEQLIESTTDESLASSVLERLDWSSTVRLLDLDENERELLLQHWRSVAWTEAAARDLTSEIEDRPFGQDMLLAECVLERLGRYGAAAALYALGHDDLFVLDDPRAAYERWVLRFKLGHAFWLRNEFDEATIRQCASFARTTSDLLSSSWNRVPKEAFFALSCQLESWLGRRWESLGAYPLADAAYSRAAVDASTADDRVANTVHAANALAKQGETQRAYERVCLIRDELDECSDELTRQLWESSHQALRIELGGDESLADNALTAPWLAELRTAMHQAEISSPGSLDPMLFEGIVEQTRLELAEASDEDVEWLHKVLVRLAQYVSITDPESDEPAALLERARSIEDGDRVPLSAVVAHRQLAARLHLHRGRPEVARALFADALDDARRVLEVEERLVFFGYYMEALGQDAAENRATIQALAVTVWTELHEALARQPGAPARRRVMMILQRVLESSLLALLALAAGRSQRDSVTQTSLGLAWQLLARGRNAELQTGGRRSAEADVTESLRLLEDDMYRALRDRLVDPSDGESAKADTDWIEGMRQLHELDLTRLEDRKALEPEPLVLPERGVALMLFEIRDLMATNTLVGLSHCEGWFDYVFLSRDEDDRARLDAWAEPFSSEVAGTVRGVRIHRRKPSGEDLAKAPGFDELLPRRTLLVPWLRPHRLGTSDTMVDTRPWHLFLDSSLGGMPLEMLPDRRGETTRFGQNRSLVFALRNQLPEGFDEPVDLRSGWLGLGGVPGTGAITALPGTEAEVRRIRRRLRERGYPANALLGREAHAERLADALAELKPSVLHLAAHGFADSRYPDACTLVLADCPSRPERELLPFRRIEELPLDSVRLVVLSACSSLVGRAVRGTTMEGLAWAFLRRGVIQVVASRYPVDDHATSRFMSVFYEHLSSHSVGMALGRARDLCLREHRLDPRQVAAWSVWC